MIQSRACRTIPPAFPDSAPLIGPIFLLQARAVRGCVNRRRALASAAATLFVKPSMAYFLGLLLIAFILIDWQRNPARGMRELASEMYPAAIVTGAIAATLFAYFGIAPVIRSLIPSQGSTMYRALSYGLFGPEGRAFLAPRGAPWIHYFADVARPRIAYTAALLVAASFSGLDTPTNLCKRRDSTLEMILTCALLHLSFIFFFFWQPILLVVLLLSPGNRPGSSRASRNPLGISDHFPGLGGAAEKVRQVHHSASLAHSPRRVRSQTQSCGRNALR